MAEADRGALTIFKNPKYAGRISLPDNVDDIYAPACLATGLTDWAKSAQEDFARASAWQREVHTLVHRQLPGGLTGQSLAN
ncbi:MAG: hypothetical protein GDA53_00130 [Rhodobacteraceae bacterium]|nr:hypothetical protein [Paracoccaceae bacterium]